MSEEQLAQRPEEDNQITTLVRAGYMTVAEIVESMTGEDEPGALDLVAVVQARVDARRAELDRERASIQPQPSAYERLSAAFEALEDRGILARENYWCCQTCAYHAIDEEIAERAETDDPANGYVLFHSQDTDRAVESGLLYLRFGGVTGDPDADPGAARAMTKAVGDVVLERLKSAHFEPEWSGSPEDCIHLPIAWDKPPPQ